MKELVLLKIGGKTVEDENHFQRILERFANLAGPKILIHGGGAQADALSKEMGIPVQMKDGRRITDLDTLRVVTMLYAGWINKQIVGKLQHLGCNAFGISGADGKSILSVKRPVKEVDYGYVGDVVEVNHKLINDLLQLDLTPVFCPITLDASGQLLNTNADTIATTLGLKLTPYFKIKLWYCMEIPGVYTDPGDPSSVISVLDTSLYSTFKAQKIISGGMLPKLENAFHALNGGITEIAIGNIDSLFNNTSTKVVK